MKIITGLVSEYVFVLLLAGLYWFWNEQKAFRLGLLLILSHWCNEAAKYAFGTPRPFHLDPSLGMIPEQGFGFPSGHAQFSLTLLIPLAWALTETSASGGAVFRSAPVRIGIRTAAGALALLIAFSRVYLGVHFPWDIAGGWLLGGLLLSVFFLCRLPAARKKANALADFFVRRGERSAARAGRAALAAAAAVSFAMLSLLPQNPVPGALFLGFCAGYIFYRFPGAKTGAEVSAQTGAGASPRIEAAARAGAFPAFPGGGKRAALVFQAALFAAGLAGAAAISVVLKGIFPGPDSPHYVLFRFIRYGLGAFWVSGGAPRLFRRLAERSGGGAGPGA
jgi:membrane-associated phospholipid phosphatase